MAQLVHINLISTVLVEWVCLLLFKSSLWSFLLLIISNNIVFLTCSNELLFFFSAEMFDGQSSARHDHEHAH